MVVIVGSFSKMRRQKLRSLLNKDRIGEQLYCNIIISACGKSFCAHRFLLSSQSNFFKRLFANDFQDRDQPEIKLKQPYGYHCCQQSYHSLQLIFDFIYTDEVILSNNNVKGALLFADYLDISSFKNECVTFLSRSIKSCNWIATFLLSKEINLPVLSQACMKTFCLYYSHIDLKLIGEQEFLGIVSFMEKSNTKPILIFKACNLWLKANSTEDRKNIVNLFLHHINFKRINTQDMKDCVLTEDIVVERPHLLKTLRRLVQKRKIILIGSSRGTEIAAVKYNPQNRRIRSLGKLKVPSSHTSFHQLQCVSVAEYDEKLFLMIKHSDGHLYIQQYDKEADKWGIKMRLNIAPKYQPVISVVENNLYVIGGDANDWFTASREVNVIDISQVIDFRNGELTTNNSGDVLRIDANYILYLTQARHGAAAVQRNDKIYILGGFEWNSISSCEVIDTKTNLISGMASMMEARTNHTAVLYEDEILVLGGWTSLRSSVSNLVSVESYSFQTDSWSYFSSFILPRSHFCACVFGKEVFIFGGHWSQTIEYFDITSNRWKYRHGINLKAVHYATV